MGQQTEERDAWGGKDLPSDRSGVGLLLLAGEKTLEWRSLGLQENGASSV